MSASALTVTRSKRDSPEPSAMRTPASRTPASRSVERTIRAPAAVDPGSATVAPRPFSTISATKLSESAFIRGTTFASRWERSKAIGSASAGARPSPARPVTAMPRARSDSVSALAAAAAEPLLPANGTSATESAESGLDSMPTYDGFQPSASRRESKYVSSPKTRP